MTSRKSTKIAKKPLSAPGSEARTQVLLEDLHSQFRVFGESLELVREKGEATFEAVGVLQEDVTTLKQDVAILKTDMVFVKDELRVIRNELKEKIGRDEFHTLETRVAYL